MRPLAQLDLFPAAPRTLLLAHRGQRKMLAPPLVPADHVDRFDRTAVNALSKPQRALLIACAAAGELSPSRGGWASAHAAFTGASAEALTRLALTRVVTLGTGRRVRRLRLTPRGARLAAAALALGAGAIERKLAMLVGAR